MFFGNSLDRHHEPFHTPTSIPGQAWKSANPYRGLIQGPQRRQHIHAILQQSISLTESVDRHRQMFSVPTVFDCRSFLPLQESKRCLLRLELVLLLAMRQRGGICKMSRVQH